MKHHDRAITKDPAGQKTQHTPGYRIFLDYLHSKRRGLMLFVLCMLTFFACCLLYQLENIGKLLYAFYLWAFIALCFGVYDFNRYAKRFKALEEAGFNIENILDLLPAPDDAMAMQYRQIITRLYDERRKLLSHAHFRDSDMNDYYTMWAHQIKVPIAAMGMLLQNAEIRGEACLDEVDSTIDKGTYQAMSSSETNRLLSEELFRIEQYVEMVLYYQRLDSINSDFLFKTYDLYAIVKEAVKKQRMFFINKKLSLNFEPFSFRVVTDEKWLQFAIGQILFNALKYTAQGSITIRLEKTEQQARLVIEDTGIGIRPEDLPRIFERGFTGYNGRLDKKSTGIGLYLCKKILEKLSHSIEVTSRIREGTQVAIGFELTKM